MRNQKLARLKLGQLDILVFLQYFQTGGLENSPSFKLFMLMAAVLGLVEMWF